MDAWDELETSVTCPYCGEQGQVDVEVDPSEPGEQVFVQDCEVCCRPWTVVVRVGADGSTHLSIDR